MIHTNWTPAEAPYTLHDMNVIAFESNGCDLILRTQSGMIKTSPPYPQPNGYVTFQDVDYDLSFIYFFDNTGNVGPFTGRKLFLKDFIHTAKNFGFSVLDETYGFHQTVYSGHMSMQRAFSACTIEIYHKGDIVFSAEE